MRVITFSRVFPSTHPRKGERTLFVEKILISLGSKNLYNPSRIQDLDQLQILKADPKYHTIRAGNRWKVGDFFSPRVWSGLPYRSKQIEFARPIEIKKIWEVDISGDGLRKTVGIIHKLSAYRTLIPLCDVAKNDGLTCDDFISWFPKSGTFQIICWNHLIVY